MRLSGFATPLACALALAAPVTAQEAPLPGLTIRTGETWIFHVIGGQPVDARRANSGDTPGPGELMISISGRMGTMMSITNNSDVWYDYSAFLTPKPGKKGIRTSVCTLMAGGRQSFENWPQAIPAVRVTDFTRATPGEMRCK